MATLRISDDLKNIIKQAVLDSCYPIGSIYLSVTKDNPSTKFGGTWALVGDGRYLVAYSQSNNWFNIPGESSGTNGGSGDWNTNDTALSIDQIPSHNHDQDGHQHRMATTNADVVWNGQPGYANTNNAWRTGYIFTSNDSGGYTNWQQPYIHPTGGGRGHNHFHVLPYYTVCVWKRTA